MKYEIMTYGRGVLRQRAEPVGEVTEDIRKLVDDMLETMYLNDGIGLAAEQVGRVESVCVIDIRPALSGDESQVEPGVAMPLVMIDPVVKAGEGRAVAREGCLSFPEIFVEVSRPETVTVEYTDIQGERKELEDSGFLARAMQHEIDHLNGILLVDKMSIVEKVAVSGRLKRLKKKSKEV